MFACRARRIRALGERREAARAALKSVFGYDDFRPGQAEIVANLNGGRTEGGIAHPGGLHVYEAPGDDSCSLRFRQPGDTAASVK